MDEGGHDMSTGGKATPGNESGGGRAREMVGDAAENPQERITRKWNEMLQELRVAQTGVQVLTGFLLTVPFSSRFDDLSTFDTRIYLGVLCASILTAGLLIAPVAFHRVLFGRSEKQWLVRAANLAARGGLGLLALTMTGVVLLVFSVVLEDRTIAWAASGATLGIFVILWLVLPALGGDGEHHPDDS